MTELDLDWLICLAMALVTVSYTGNPIQSDAANTWIDSLPADVRSSILWSADHEEGALSNWEYDGNKHTNGGGIFNTGTPSEAIAAVERMNPHSGGFCAKATIHNAFLSRNGSKAVRLMRWTDKPWDKGGKQFPKSAYFGVWMRIDHVYDTKNKTSPSGGWWNVFQFKSEDKNAKSQPVWVLNIGNHPSTGKMQFYLYSERNRPRSISQKKPIPIPVGRWFHVETYYRQSSTNSADGKIAVWQDGKLIVQADDVVTVLAGPAVWGIGNYTEHISGGEKPGTATIYFDDATVATKPTHSYGSKIKNRRR